METIWQGPSEWMQGMFISHWQLTGKFSTVSPHICLRDTLIRSDCEAPLSAVIQHSYLLSQKNSRASIDLTPAAGSINASSRTLANHSQSNTSCRWRAPVPGACVRLWFQSRRSCDQRGRGERKLEIRASSKWICLFRVWSRRSGVFRSCC